MKLMTLEPAVTETGQNFSLNMLTRR